MVRLPTPAVRAQARDSGSASWLSAQDVESEQVMQTKGMARIVFVGIGLQHEVQYVSQGLTFLLLKELESISITCIQYLDCSTHS